MFRSYGIEHGLRNLAAYHLEQDAQGSIWVGTEDGLYRYDGQRFEQVSEEAGLPAADIMALHRAGDGTLWVGIGKAVAVQEGARFRVLGPEQGVPTGGIWGITSQYDGTVYVNVEGMLVVGGRTTGFPPADGPAAPARAGCQRAAPPPGPPRGPGGRGLGGARRARAPAASGHLVPAP